MNIPFENPDLDDQTLTTAEGIKRGVSRYFRDLGNAVLREFRLSNGRRVDLIGLDAKGKFTIVEVKSSPADFRTDDKWPEYLAYCDSFYFAVAAGFPMDLIPEDCGLIVADAYGAVVRRPAPPQPMNATRRRAQILRFGLAGAGRLERLLDPQP